ncbi:MAG: alpha-amylase family glycosyl hydrolase [Acidimicrobiia bacterium]|nr:alpha-amylase family glycosyl hydrolase [Acidimicrobiia bacterium]
MSNQPWWQTTVVYQIYPRSFQDTTGNGIGDLPGITSRLDYLADILGVGAIWISPFYKSPMADFGYDVADYTSVDPMFGTMNDFDELLEGVHRRGMKLIIDWVPNHSSTEHPWFIESRSSRDNPKRDWYTWRDPKPDGSPPNNWISAFSGPAWNLDEETGQYYLCTFTKEQADLNWRNPEVQEAMFEDLRFWLDRGVDGIRIDVAHFIMKDPQLRDNPRRATKAKSITRDHGEYDMYEHLYDKGHPDNHVVHRDVRALLDSYQPERFSVGEIHIADLEEWSSYYGDLDELHFPFNFSLMYAPWTAAGIGEKVNAAEEVVPPGGWPSYVLGNHDEPRIATRFGEEQMPLAAMLLLTLRGQPTLYYGDEIAIPQRYIPSAEQQDPHGQKLEEAGRDGCRTPMQWDDSFQAGFSPPGADAPWLPLSDDWAGRNVARQLDDPQSLLNLYRALLAYRKSSPALQAGDYRQIEAPEGCLAYQRDNLTVALNFTDGDIELSLAGEVGVTTYLDDAATPGRLRPHEGLIIET